MASLILRSLDEDEVFVSKESVARAERALMTEATINAQKEVRKLEFLKKVTDKFQGRAYRFPDRKTVEIFDNIIVGRKGHLALVQDARHPTGREHCGFLLKDGRWCVKALHSVTFLGYHVVSIKHNDIRIKVGASPRLLETGDILIIGNKESGWKMQVLQA